MSPVLEKIQINCCWRLAYLYVPGIYYKRRRNKNEEKKHEILVHGWLSATLDLPLYACLLALSQLWSTRTCYCMYLLLLLSWCCCIAVGCGVAINTTAAYVNEGTEETEKMKYKHTYQGRTGTKENENTEYKKRVEAKKSWNGPASNRRRRCSAGNLRGQGGANRARSEKRSTSWARQNLESFLKSYLVNQCKLDYKNWKH